jgi:hypothetical protein
VATAPVTTTSQCLTEHGDGRPPDKEAAIRRHHDGCTHRKGPDMSSVIHDEETGQKADLHEGPNSGGPYKFHDQPSCLEHVVNDINRELYTTPHELKLGAAALLRFFATVAWTSKENHPERYATINPRYASIGAMAKMIGAGERATRDYLTALDSAKFIRRQQQVGGHYSIWLRWTDEDRKLRKASYTDDSEELIESPLIVIDGPDRFDNRYWVNPKTGQFWRHDNHKHKVADDEVQVTLSSREARFFWSKNAGLDTTKRRKIMDRLANERNGHTWLSYMIDDFDRRTAANRGVR